MRLQVYSFSKLTRTVSKVKNSGKIDQHLDLIAGLPQEDYNSFRKTFNDVFELGPEELQLGFLKMLRGTGMRQDAEKYGYVYMDNAPYEILGNDILPFTDLIRIKRVEDVLEKYWNAHRMDHTMNYLIKKEFASAFDFFQEFGDYWEARGWQKIGHQLEDLFTRLKSFLLDRGTSDMDVIEGFMKLDYFLGHKYRPRKIWWDFTLNKSEQTEYMKLLAEQPEHVSGHFSSLSIPERDLHKHVMIEVLPFSLESYLLNGSIEQDHKDLLVIYYQPDAANPAQFFTMPIRQPATT
jgi:anaerobic magnesium-protoporphyrin IX monomethyl ester cyclase